MKNTSNRKTQRVKVTDGLPQIQLDSKRENMGKSNMFNENIINKGLESLSDSD